MYIDTYIPSIHTTCNKSRIVSCPWSFESNLKDAGIWDLVMFHFKDFGPSEVLKDLSHLVGRLRVPP